MLFFSIDDLGRWHLALPTESGIGLWVWGHVEIKTGEAKDSATRNALPIRKLRPSFLEIGITVIMHCVREGNGRQMGGPDLASVSASKILWLKPIRKSPVS